MPGYIEDGIAAARVTAGNCPGILLIGDSIRRGYCGTVKKQLQGKAEVYYPDDNCRNSQYIITNLRKWATEFPADSVQIVQFNCGHWDIAHWSGAPESLTSPEEYARLVRVIIRQLRQFYPSAQLVTATTSCMNPNGSVGYNPRTDTEIERYNQILTSAAREYGLPVNDLYAVTKQYPESAFADYCHLTEEYFEKLGVAVAEYLSKYLK